ncbi:MAG: alpha-amylase family glycosyl hydrolase [Devosia sp.]
MDHLVDLGITAVELMPIAEFRGRWNWGYDGAMLFAPHAEYGRPDDLKAFVDAAHQRGLSVFLDVVYNHFGLKGNYLGIYAPVMTDKHETPWGPAVNFDDEGSRMIREMVLANARQWLNEYRFDGLRFDAVHEIMDTGPKHMLQDLAEQLRGATDGRHIHLVAENSLNQANWLDRREDGSPKLYTAQWNDDVHHALHTALTDEEHWYYTDFAGRMDLLGRALAEGFAWQGEYLQHEQRQKGEPSAHLPPTAFVAYAQNHDQAGNRPLGERLEHLVPREAARAVTAIVLLSPQIPLLFMGEEWAASSPVTFFSDVGEDLAEAIREARNEEFKDFPLDISPTDVPDPMAESTFELCKLNWGERDEAEHAEFLGFYRRLIQLRKDEIIPRLYDIGANSGRWRMLAPPDHRGAVAARRRLDPDPDRQPVTRAGRRHRALDRGPSLAGRFRHRQHAGAVERRLPPRQSRTRVQLKPWRPSGTPASSTPFSYPHSPTATAME